MIAVGPEAGTGDDEALDPEAREAVEPLRARIGRADHCEAIDEVGACLLYTSPSPRD